MKKIPTLFEREYENHKVVGIKPIVTPGMEWVLNGDGYATVKIDGSCCAVFGGALFRRYDAKKGKKPPEGSIPCQRDPDPVTGHWPHWVECQDGNPADKWYLEAYHNQDLVDRFNIYCCKHKNWLPPSYGKRKYEDMPAAEQAVVDEFQGREAYENIMRRADYFLAPVSSGEPLQAICG